MLAAGASRRMGRPKLLMPFGGSTLLERAVATALASGVGEVAVVTGAYAREMNSLLVSRSVAILENAQWETGQASSVRTAVAWAQEQGFSALLIMVADQPFVTEQHLRNLAAQLGSDADICITACGSRTGNPALFSAACFPQMESLVGDEGARVLVRKGLRCGTPRVCLAESADPDVFDDVDDEDGYHCAMVKMAAR